MSMRSFGVWGILVLVIFSAGCGGAKPAEQASPAAEPVAPALEPAAPAAPAVAASGDTLQLGAEDKSVASAEVLAALPEDLKPGVKGCYTSFEENALPLAPFQQTWADAAKGSSITIAIVGDEKHKGSRALKVDFKHGADPSCWGSGFHIAAPLGWEKPLDISAFKSLSCWVKGAQGMQIALSVRDIDDEEFRSAWFNVSTNDWFQLKVALSDMKPFPYGGNQNGNKQIDREVRGVVVSLDGKSTPKQGTLFFDDFRFE